MKRPETVQTEKHEKPKMKKTACCRAFAVFDALQILMLGAILLTVGGNLLSLADRTFRVLRWMRWNSAAAKSILKRWAATAF